MSFFPLMNDCSWTGVIVFIISFDTATKVTAYYLTVPTGRIILIPAHSSQFTAHCSQLTSFTEDLSP